MLGFYATMVHEAFLISSRGRYNHFDSPPYIFIEQSQNLSEEKQEKVAFFWLVFIKLRLPRVTQGNKD